MSGSEPRLGLGAILAAAVVVAATVAVAQDAPIAGAPVAIERTSAAEHIAEEEFVRALGMRGPDVPLNASEASRLDAVVATRRAIDFEVQFAFGSAELRGRDRAVIEQLGAALVDEAFRDSIFLIIGHTDARGAAEDNRKLSAQRAQAVKTLLVSEFGVAPERLVAIGYGASHLENADDPLASENRRIQVVNIMAFKKKAS